MQKRIASRSGRTKPAAPAPHVPHVPLKGWRFSLRTLLIFVLLIGCSALLWWNRGPWAPGLMIEEEYSIETACFSPDGKLVCTQTTNQPGETGHLTDFRVALWDAATGRRLKSLNVRPGEGVQGRICFSPAGRHLMVRTESGAVLRLWSLPSYRELIPGTVRATPGASISFSAREKFALVREDSSAELVALPDWKQIAWFEYGFVNYEPFTPDEKYLAIRVKNALQIIATETGKIATELPVFTGATVRVSNRAVLIGDYDAKHILTTRAVELPGGKELGSVPGDEQSKEIRWSIRGSEPADVMRRISPDERMIYTTDKIFALGSETPLVDFSEERWTKTRPESPIFFSFSSDSKACLFGGSASTQVAIWNRTRPLEWYGLAWLREFWVVVVFALGLIWSIWRDRH